MHAFYYCFGLYKGSFPDKHIKYILFIRLLCQESINLDDTQDSHKLIVEFVREYKILYGEESMNFNMHGHLHLPHQAYRIGPRVSRDLFHGSKNY